MALEQFGWDKAQEELKRGQFVARYAWNRRVIEGEVSATLGKRQYLALDNDGKMIIETPGGTCPIDADEELTDEDKTATDWYSREPYTISLPPGWKRYAPYTR